MRTNKEILDILDSYWLNNLCDIDYKSYVSNYGGTKVGATYELTPLCCNGFFDTHITLVENDNKLYLVECDSRGVLQCTLKELRCYKSLNFMSVQDIEDLIDGVILVNK